MFENDDHYLAPQEGSHDASLNNPLAVIDHPSSSFTRFLVHIGEGRLINSVQLCLLVLLIYGSTFYVYSYQFQGASLRIEHLATIALILLSPFLIARASNKELRELWPFLFFGAYIMVSIFSVLLHSQNYQYSFFEIGLQVLTIIAAIFVFLIINNDRKAFVFMAAILSFGLFEGALGLFGVLYSSLSHSEVMAQHTRFVFMVPKGTQNEANVYGSYMLPIAIIAWVLFRTSKKHRNTLILGAIATFSFFCVIYSYTRAAWIACIVSLVLVELALRYKLHLRFSILHIVIAIFICLAIFVMLASFLSVPLKIDNDDWYISDTKLNLFNFISKGAHVTDSSDLSINSRIQVTETALDKLKVYPFLGPGARAYRDIHMDVAQKATPAFNYSLLALYNSGIVGFPLFVAFIFIALRRSYQSIKYSPGPVSIACGVGFVALMIVYNTSSTLLSSYPWLLFGITLRMYHIGKKDQASS